MNHLKNNKLLRRAKRLYALCVCLTLTAAPHGDQDLAGMIVPQVEVALQIGGDLPPELEHPGVGGIFGVAPLQGVDARVPDVPGRDEIGLADP